ncbi:MAG: KH domain-containing protein [Deltaproteobacteria bacterium]|nr:KH domain-containing protein [Deltaproteobacteria bacterium]
MDFVEAEGDSIDSAIDNALKLLGVPRDKVTIDVLSEGRKGILGFGAQKAKVRAALRKAALEPTKDGGAAEPVDYAALTETAVSVLGEILQRMSVAASVGQKSTAAGAEIILEVKAADSGLLIGRKGQTLEALQYLVGRIAGERQGSEGPHIVIDIENYRERRRKSLEDMALRLGEKAKRQRKTVTVDALSAADRRIIHAALQDDPWVTTKSLGQGSYRRLLIIPEGDRKIRDEAIPAGHEPVPARPQRRGGQSRGAPKPAKNEG